MMPLLSCVARAQTLVVLVLAQDSHHALDVTTHCSWTREPINVSLVAQHPVKLTVVLVIRRPVSSVAIKTLSLSKQNGVLEI